MEDAILCCGPAILLVGVLWLLLRLRYDRWPALAAAVIIVISSIAASFLLGSRSLRYYPGEWRQVATLETEPSEFEYRANLGLFVHTSSGENRITGIVPACLPDGMVAHCISPSTQESSAIQIREIEIPAMLPPPPDQPLYQIALHIPCPNVSDASAIVSYAAYTDGSIWCTERVDQGGPGGMMEVVSMLINAMGRMITIFAVSFPASTAIAIVVLEIHSRRKRGKEIEAC
jgi:hypothetical protein